ncbi:MAG: T9SS type A sorting domain-containing protein [Chitinophagales bacterium]
MNRTFTIFILLFPFFCSATGVIENTFGSVNCYDEGTSVVVLDSGTYLVSGSYLNVNSSNWQSKLYYLDDNLDSTSTIDQAPVNGYSRKCSDGNLFFWGGNTAGFNYDSIQISKTNVQGQLIWKNSYRIACKNTVTDLREDADGNILISGFYSKSGCNLPVYNAFIAKLNSSGQMLWIEKIDGGKNDQLHQLSIDHNGNIVSAGWSNSFNNRGDTDFFLVMYGSNGNELFSKSLDYETQDYAYGLTTDDSGNIYISGYSNDVELLKFNLKGNKVFQQSYFSACGGSNFRIQKSEHNTLLMLGSEEIDNTCMSFFMETDMQGNVLWKKNWNARLRNFEVIQSGSYILTGYKNHLPEVYVVKFDSITLQAPIGEIGDADSFSFDPNSDNPDELEDVETNIGTIEEEEFKLNLYPNPFSNNLYVKWSSHKEVEQVIVYTMTGQILGQYNINATQKILNIDASTWVSGTYIIYTELENGEIFTEKVQKF